MSYAFDIPETTTKDDEREEDEGEDLVSDDEEDEKTILSMVPLADMLCVYLQGPFSASILKHHLADGELDASHFILLGILVLTYIWQERRCRQEQCSALL
jgi:hypothetical protein